MLGACESPDSWSESQNSHRFYHVPPRRIVETFPFVDIGHCSSGVQKRLWLQLAGQLPLDSNVLPLPELHGWLGYTDWPRSPPVPGIDPWIPRCMPSQTKGEAYRGHHHHLLSQHLRTILTVLHERGKPGPGPDTVMDAVYQCFLEIITVCSSAVLRSTRVRSSS